MIDKDAVISFFNACYLQVHEASIEDIQAKYQERERKRLQTLSKKLAKLRSTPGTAPKVIAKVEASLATPGKHNQIVSVDDMQVLVSHIFHNVMYWRNGWKSKYERYPDIFERDEEGRSYWGYDHSTRDVATVVSPMLPFPVDEVYRRWFLAERKRDQRTVAPDISAPPQRLPRNFFKP